MSFGDNSALLDADKIAAELSQRGLRWADTDAAFKALDDTVKSVLAECMIEHKPDASSVAEAEMRARADERYRNHLDALGKARREANRARVAYDTYRAWLELKRTNAATDRALMGLR